MRLLCDANVGSIIANALTAAGHDVIRAIHLAPHAPDETILAHAVDEDRILVTCDRDFGELVFKHRALPPPGIIYIRFEPDNVADIVPRLIAVLDFDALKGHMTVIGDRAVRRTTFPVKSANDG